MRPVIFAPQTQRATGANVRHAVLSWGLNECERQAAVSNRLGTEKWRAGSLQSITRWLTQHTAVDQADSSLVVGGMTFGPDHGSLTCMAQMLERSSDQGHYALGVSFERSHCPTYQKELSRFIRSCRFVGVRDDISYQVLDDLGVDARYERTFDLSPLILGMDGVDLYQGERRGIAVSVSGNLGSYLSDNDHLRQRLGAMLNRVAKESGEPVYFIDFCSDGLNEDALVHRSLAAKLCPTVESHFVAYNPNCLSVLKKMSSVRLCLAQRVDTLGMAYLAGTPCFQLWPLDEYAFWLDDYALPEQYAIDLRYGSLDIAMHRILSGLEHGFIAPGLAREEAWRRAASNWMFSDLQTFKSQCRLAKAS